MVVSYDFVIQMAYIDALSKMITKAHIKGHESF